MFSRAKRFNYPEPKQEASPPCHRHIKNHKLSQKSIATSTPKVKKNVLPEDLQKTLEQLKFLENRIQSRCDAMESLCLSPSLISDEGFISIRSSSPEEQDEDSRFFTAIEISKGTEAFAEMVAEIVYDKIRMNQKQKAESFWMKTKSFFNKVNCDTKNIFREFVWPVVIQGTVEQIV